MTNRVSQWCLASFIASTLLLQCACVPIAQGSPNSETFATETILPSPPTQERPNPQSDHDASGTQMAESLQTPTYHVGVVVSMPSKVRWEWSGNYHEWNWDVHLKRSSDSPITLKSRKIEVFTAAGDAYQRVDSLNVVISPRGEWVDHVQIIVSPAHEFHNATCLITYNGADQEISWYVDQAVTRLSNEQK